MSKNYLVRAGQSVDPVKVADPPVALDDLQCDQAAAEHGDDSGGNPEMTQEQLDLVGRLAAQLRVDSIRCSTRAGSRHPSRRCRPLTR